MTRRALRYAGVWLFLGRIGIALIVLVSLIPLPQIPVRVEQGDKLGHLLAYFLITVWYAQLYTSRAELAWRALAFVALGGVIELLQGLTSYRSAEWLDFAADGLGVALGCALGMTAAGMWLQKFEARLRR